MADSNMIDWSYVFLRQNPFPETPPRPREDVPWAGMESLKKRFLVLFRQASSDSALQVVLNHGDYGSGKTHAAVYFSDTSNWPKSKRLKNIVNLYVRTPSDSAKGERQLYQDIIESLGFETIRRAVRETIDVFGYEPTVELLKDYVESNALVHAIMLLGQPQNAVGQFTLFESVSRETVEWRRLLEAYFFSQVSKGDLKTLGLSRGIDGAQDRYRVLSGILQCLIGLQPIERLEDHTRVVLWIDEMEDLIYYPSSKYLPFTQSLRDLIDRLPNYFTLIVNFTLASPEAFEDVSVVLGKALMDRITHTIYFSPPNEKEAYKYVTELLQYYRSETQDHHKLPPTYPFETATLNEIINLEPIRTPRALNKRFSDIITKALMKGVISGPGEGIISMDFVNSLVKEDIDHEFT